MARAHAWPVADDGNVLETTESRTACLGVEFGGGAAETSPAGSTEARFRTGAAPSATCGPRWRRSCTSATAPAATPGTLRQ